MNSEMTKTTIEGLRLPMCHHGFRSGWARAVVNGVHQRLWTSRSDETDYNDHAAWVRDQFVTGKGEVEQ